MTGSKVAVNLMDYLPTAKPTPPAGTRPKQAKAESLDEFLRRYGLATRG